MNKRRTIIGERELETWLSVARLAGFIFAALEIGVFVDGFPPGYMMKGSLVTVALGIGTVVFFALARWMPTSWEAPVGFAALVFDTCIIAAYATIFSYEYGNQVRWAFVLVVAEAALRYGLVGGLVMPLVLIPLLAYCEYFRAEHFGPPGFTVDRVSFPTGVLLLSGLVVGWLVRRLHQEAQFGLARAQEAETLRDELGRHVDALEAANRCARALGSSLEIEDAFSAFIEELQEVVPFDRVAIVLVENDAATTIATAGRRRERSPAAREHRPGSKARRSSRCSPARRSCAAISPTARTTRIACSSRSGSAAGSSLRCSSVRARSA